MGKLFGTDGVRGIANKELTNDLAYKLGRFGSYELTKELNKKKAKILVGMDTRISGDMLESSLVAGILSAGNDVVKVGVVPTPTIAYLVREMGFDAGVMISASHNPYEYNGIKFFDNKGLKLPDSVEERIEDYILNNKDLEFEVVGDFIGSKTIDTYLKYRYLEHVKGSIDTTFNNLKIVLDAANGSAYELAEIAFRDLGAKVVVINNHPDGVNINMNCGSTHLESLKYEVKQREYDFGIAFDGDADRMLAVDKNGNEIDGDKIIALISLVLKNEGKLRNNKNVVTVMSNIGFDIKMKENEIEVEKTKVGDRYVLEKMINENLSIGGEQSGHIILLDYNTTGDGILTGLKFIESTIKLKIDHEKVSEIITLYPQILLNAKVKREVKDNYLGYERINKRIEEIENSLHGKGRVLIRPSGTEPLVRVMLEGENQEILNNYAKELVTMYESIE
jgi:phosphoglucosamine mutase